MIQEDPDVFTKVMATAETFKVHEKKPQEVIDAVVASFFSVLKRRILESEPLDYHHYLDFLTRDEASFNQKRQAFEFQMASREADLFLDEFNAIFETHTGAYWKYVSRSQLQPLVYGSEFFRTSWQRHSQVSSDAILLLKKKAKHLTANLEVCQTPCHQKQALYTLRSMDLAALQDAWLRKTNPITGLILELGNLG
jgi:hypothetical protein